MKYKNIFRRYEIKYIVNERQRKILTEHINEHMKHDEWSESTVCNIYYDTDSFLMIRRSIEKPLYKEKLRLRSYGTASPDSVVFAELKKKFNDVVYKRRVSMSEKDAMDYLSGSPCVISSQITREIDYALKLYENLAPRVFISYEREAFFANDDDDFRVTFDRNIRWRDYDLSLCGGCYGSPLLDDGISLMEIKTGTAIPLWMVKVLSELKLYKTSFSKYGSAYQQLYINEKRGLHHA